MPATKQQIRQIIADNNLNSVADVYSLLRESFKDILQELMEAELDATLGYEKNQKGEVQTSNKRNGHSPKTLKSQYGEFQIDVPRDREGEFEPKLIPKYQRDISGIEEKVISLYARGMSTRDIHDQIQELYGMELSAEMVSKITDRILPEIKEWQSRPLNRVYLARMGCHYSALTIHKYMNTEMRLHSLVRPKKPGYRRGKPHKVFENKLQREFQAERANHKWCTDFTYLFLKNGETRYNCSIVDLYDRSVIASVTERQITSGLAIRTLKKALESQPQIKEELILHSDQGSQYTSKAFVEFCESVHVSQSMSKAGCPYDNAPMERYFNTLKNECVNLYEFQTQEALYQAVEEFAYVTYNHVRPHSYNGYRTPYQARTAS